MKKIVFALLATLALVACNKPEPTPIPKPDGPTVSVILNGEAVKEIPCEVAFPSNYHEIKSTFNFTVKGEKGEKGTPIKLSIEGKDAAAFATGFTTIKDRKKDGNPSKEIAINFTGKKEQTSYEAILVATYQDKRFEFPLKGSVKLLAADVVVPPTADMASKVTAKFNGAELKNGSTIKISAVMANANGTQYQPEVELNFPKVYNATVASEKNFEGPMQWCVGPTCIANAQKQNPWNYGATKAGNAKLELDLPFAEMNVKGYKNKVTVTFTDGDDKFEFFLDFDIK